MGNTFQKLSPMEEAKRRKSLVDSYERRQQKERRAWWWYNRLRDLIRTGEIEGSKAVELYGKLYGTGERYNYLKQYIRDAKS